MARFTVIHLQESRLDETLPLVRTAAPLVTAERWRQFARSLRDSGGGILAAFAGDGPAHGVAAYRLEESLVHGRTLRVEPMITFELSRSAPARAALCRALELLALDKECDSLIVSAASRGYADPKSPKTGAWATLDFDLASVALVKRLAPRQPAAASPG
ncbi:MAG: hypothetical protein ACXW27_08750 [Allosphingosinicella sp.]